MCFGRVTLMRFFEVGMAMEEGVTLVYHLTLSDASKCRYAGSVIDSHCHLADPKFAEDLDQVLERAREAGVTKMVAIADSLEESKQCIALAKRHAEMYCTVGVHPHVAREWRVESAEVLRKLVHSSPKVVAIGEIGLDYHYDHSPRNVQRSVFAEQLMLAASWGMPVVVHCREAIQDVRTIVEDARPPKLVLHCCSDRWEDVRWFIDQGYFLSFTGMATYPKAEVIRDTIQKCPIERIMIETDAPYLPPEALRAKGGRAARNEPAHVVEVAKVVAEVKGMTLEEVDSVTTRTTIEFFGLPKA